jgi:transcription antitermination factor NusG
MSGEVRRNRFREGDSVRIACGSMFDGYEAKVIAAPVDPPGEKIAILVEIFGRPVRLELEDWMIEPVS